MKILFINTFYYPDNIGGTERSLKLLCEGLVSKGHDVGVFCLSKNKKKEHEIINGVHVYRSSGGRYDVTIKIGEKSKVGIKKWLNKIIEFNNKGCCVEFIDVLKEFSPDVINTNNLNGISTRVWKLSKQNHIPLIHTVRDYWLLSYTYTERNSCIDRIYSKFHKKNAKFIDLVTGASSYIVNTFSEALFFENAKYVVIPNSVVFEKKELQEILNNKKKRTNKVVFMFAGHLDKTKGIDLLISALKKIKNDNIILNIFGDGPLKEKCINAASEDHRIKYLGKISSEEITIQYDLADVVIVPSIWAEPFGRVLIEGFCRGCTVIANTVGGMPEIINTMQAGTLFSNENELVDAIIKYSCRQNIINEYSNIENNIKNIT